MGPDAAPPIETQLKEVILDRIQVASAAGVARSVLEGADVRVVGEPFADQLIARLSSYVMAERLLKDSTEVPFSKEVEVVVPPRPTRKVALAALALAMTLTGIGIAAGSIAIAAAAVAVAALGVFALVEPLDDVHTVARVTGNVTVDATFFRSFPEQTALPPHYGRPVPLVELASPLAALHGEVER